MKHPVLSAKPGESTLHARETMERHRVNQLPVLVDATGRILGILTDRDLHEHHGHLRERRVSGAMTEAPATVTPDDSIETAAQLLLDRRVGALPVLDGDRHLAGILTATDLLRGLLHRPGRAGVRTSRDNLETGPRR